MAIKKQIIIHPLFFAIFPVLFIFSHNRAEALVIGQMAAPLAISIITALLLWAILGLVFRNWRKSALITSVSLLLFFSYGHFYSALTGVTFVGIKLWQHRYLLGGCGVLFLIIFIWAVKTRRKLDKLTLILNAVSAVLVIISLINTVTYTVWRSSTRQRLQAAGEGIIPLSASGPGAYPDIYYIILDSYANAHTLRDIYNFDNDDFIQFLEGKGFYVASLSCSNYGFSAPSLASSLNYEYLDYLRGADGNTVGSSVALFYLIENNKVIKFLKSRGYTIIHFDSGWGGTERNRHADIEIKCGYGNEFVMVLAQTTMLLPFKRPLNLIADDARKRIIDTFARAADISQEIPGPKFVFAHINCPHPPFIFGPEGEPLEMDMLSMTKWEKKKAYSDQVRFVNSKTEELVTTLLSDPEKLPVILIQADHGPISVRGFKNPSDRFLTERMRILNAYFLPGAAGELLYPSISPVNTFRLIFNYYFDQDYPLLPDKSFYAGDTTSYDFYEVTDRVEFSGN